MDYLLPLTMDGDKFRNVDYTMYDSKNWNDVYQCCTAMNMRKIQHPNGGVMDMNGLAL